MIQRQGTIPEAENAQIITYLRGRGFALILQAVSLASINAYEKRKD